MESPASAAGPRVYVPINHPDSPVPTYAVLQFLGFSPPPDPKQTPLLHTHFVPPAASPSPPIKFLPCTSPVSNPPSPAPKRGASPTDSSSNSSCDEKEKKLTSIKPSPMKKSASAGTHASMLSPGARRNGKGIPLGATISISHTDKDTIIHTHSSNFREVVHQLTGATSGNKDLLPVTMPTRSIIRSSSSSNDKDLSPVASPMRVLAQNGGNHNQVNGKQEASGVSTSLPITCPKLLETGSMRRPIASTTTKLLERRKSNKVLERLSTSCRNLPPLVPSPVTPLASDFEKICLPCTPSTSEGSSTVVTPAPCTPAACATPLLHDVVAMEVLPAAKVIPSPGSKGIPHTYDSKAVEAVSMDPKGVDGVGSLGDVMDMQGPSVLHGNNTPSLGLSDGKDVHAPSTPHTVGVRGSSLCDAMDMQGPSLVLATGITDAMDLQHDVVAQEVSVHDAMDTEGQSLCNGEGVQGSTSMVANRTPDEESAIAKKSFFFHSQRPRHGDPMLLRLFPEYPREL